MSNTDDSTLPASIRAAIASGTPGALQAALDALPADERTRAETLIQQVMVSAVEAAQRRSPADVMAALPPRVREALVRQDDAAFQAALAALPEAARQQTLNDLATLQTQQHLMIQQEQQRDPRDRFGPMLRDFAAVALGSEGLRQGAAETLIQLEQNGWMLRGPVERIWAGERRHDALVVGLDAQDTLLVERVLELVESYEHGGQPAPDRALAELPVSLRVAIERQDQAAFDAAMLALSGEERARVVALLAALQGEPPPDPLRSDIDQVIQDLLPLLGDIALGAFGDPTARQLAEAMLRKLDEGGWGMEQPARRIWAGERDAAALTAGIDPNSAALVVYTLGLVAQGPEALTAAGSLQLAGMRRRADMMSAQLMARGSRRQRADMARQFEELAAQADQQLGAPWGELASHMRELAGRLKR